MRIAPKDPFWLVTDAGTESSIEDVLSQTDLAGLQRQFAGGLSMATNPTIVVDEAEAREEAERRLLARRIYERLVSCDAGQRVAGVVLDGEEVVVVYEGETQ